MALGACGTSYGGALRVGVEGAGATAAGAGGAAEAMVCGEDGLGGDGCGRDVPEEKRVARGALLHAQHLVEVAVEDFAFVADVDGAAAHEAIDGGGVEAVGEQFHVAVPFAVLAQVRSEAGDGQVGDGEEAGENDAVALEELGFVIGLEFGLVRREFGADGVIDECEW